MPGWIQYLSVINPITYAVEAVRAVITSTPDLAMFVKGFVAMIVFAGVALTWAVTAFNALRD
jgi:ABC-type multidrug transport system permease subunit